MLKPYDTIRIGSHFMCAIEYGDTTGLNEEEERLLDDFLATLPRGPLVWEWGDESEFGYDPITHMRGDVIEVTIYAEESAQ